MIASSRGAAYRRFYLYSALSIAVIALTIAAALLLREGLQLAGFGVRSGVQDSSRGIALSIALIALAIPVGGAHLWLIRRSLADPAERASAVRHQFLNLWVLAALLAELFTGQALMNTAARSATADVTGQAAAMAVIGVVGAVAAWWIARTPPVTAQPRVRVSVAAMLVSMAVLAFSIGNAASAAGGLFAYPYRDPVFGSRFDPTVLQQQTLTASSGIAGIALAVWVLGYAWQRRWPETRDRLAYLLVAYGLGTAILLVGTAFAIGGAMRFARDTSDVATFTGAWPAVAAGAVLVVIHFALLARDRGRNGHPAATTDQLMLAFPALVGLGMAVGGIGLGWHALLERDVVAARHLTDDLSQSAALLLIGLAAYVPAWLSFRMRTTAGSAVRRFYLFTVVCLALLGGLISGVILVYSAITALAGVGERDAALTALTWIMPAVLLAAVFAAHLVLLLRDQRETRTPAAAPDPLIALLEEVRAGRVSVEGAAATIRQGSIT